MFTKSLCRAARPIPPIPVCASTTSRILPALVNTAARASSQPRRYSSSKTSSAPGGSRGSEAAANGTAPTATTTSSTNATSPEPSKRSTGRVTRRKSRDVAPPVTMSAEDEAFANLPSVPPTNLQPHDISMSSFFALHRPVSVTTPLPPAIPSSAFASIFESRTPKNKIDDTIYTLSSAVSALETSGQSAEEKNLRWEVMNEQGGSRAQRLDELVKQFRPFNVPPPPVPFDDATEAAQNTKAEQQQHNADGSRRTRGRRNSETGAQTPTRKTYRTTLIINKATSASGQDTWSFSATPIIETKPSADVPTQRTLRQQEMKAQEEGKVVREPVEGRTQRQMVLISVKRRRKLKMKKHKYKKLMRRTRNQRRREGRL